MVISSGDTKSDIDLNKREERERSHYNWVWRFVLMFYSRVYLWLFCR